jgi:hypothetical protein
LAQTSYGASLLAYFKSLSFLKSHVLPGFSVLGKKHFLPFRSQKFITISRESVDEDVLCVFINTIPFLLLLKSLHEKFLCGETSRINKLDNGRSLLNSLLKQTIAIMIKEVNNSSGRSLIIVP